MSAVDGGSTDCYHTSGRQDSTGNYMWMSTGNDLTYEVFCFPGLTGECISMDHGCWLYWEPGSCSKLCAALCEVPPA